MSTYCCVKDAFITNDTQRRLQVLPNQLQICFVFIFVLFSVISHSIQTADTNYLNFSACLSFFFVFFKLLFDIYLGIYLSKIFQQHDPLQV